MILSGSAVQMKGVAEFSLRSRMNWRMAILKIEDGSEDAAAKAPPRNDGEEAFDGVEPECRGWGEMEDPARMIGRPFPDLGMLARGAVVGDGVDHFSGRDGPLDGVEELDQSLMGMLGHATTDDGPVETLRAANRVVVPLRL